MKQASSILEELCGAGAVGTGVLIVAAHPDDEVIGAGAQLHRWPSCRIVHVTDGAPENMRDAHAAGFATRESYGACRQYEAEAALALAGIVSSRLERLELIDQQVSFHLPVLVEKLTEVLQRLAPEAILTHAYEGGHPDHDATALAVHCACVELEKRGVSKLARLEMTSYHNQDGKMAAGLFLGHPELPVRTLNLTAEDQARKRRMFDCFATQQEVLVWFPIKHESFRPAPDYDFTQQPHPGPLYYELFDWGMTGSLWRQLASRCLASRGLASEIG